MLCPSSSIVPVVLAIGMVSFIRFSVRRKVDLPQPDGPMKATTSSIVTSIDTSLIACFAPLAQYQNFLLLIGSVFAPLFGVVLVDHFILRKRSARVSVSLFRWSTLLAWGGGVLTYHLLANLFADVGATLPALLLAGLLQWVLGRNRV